VIHRADRAAGGERGVVGGRIGLLGPDVVLRGAAAVQVARRAGERARVDDDPVHVVGEAGERVVAAAGGNGRGDERVGRIRGVARVGVAVQAHGHAVAAHLIAHVGVAVHVLVDRSGDGAARVVYRDRRVRRVAGAGVAVCQHELNTARTRCRAGKVGILVSDVADERLDRRDRRVGVERDDQVRAARSSGKGANDGSAVGDVRA